MNEESVYKWNISVVICDTEVNQDMVATVSFEVMSHYDLNLTNRNPWFSSFLVSSNHLSRKSS
jgi:hypothetical protein